MRKYPITEIEDVQKAVDKAVSDGMQVMLGGGSLLEFADKFPIPAYYVDVDESGITQTINEAISISEEVKKEKLYNKVIKAFLEHFSGGMAAVDINCRIFISNMESNNMAALPESRLSGANINTVSPQLDMNSTLKSMKADASTLLSLRGINYVC